METTKNGTSATDENALAPDDANWMMTAAFIIFTMQTGFGMLESGCVSTKNEVNIMMKNVVDIFLGGLSYWCVGYGLSFGKLWTCPVLAIGEFALDTDRIIDSTMGTMFTNFLFQLSFATTATTIVSGAMAERCNFGAYCMFSVVNTLVYCVPAGWVWGHHGFLYNMGVIDIAGSGPVHLIGGASALASALMLGPRLGRYDPDGEQTLGTPVNCAMGLFVLWWGWLAFNSGSTYGVSGAKWQYAARAAVMTMLSSFGGGVVGLIYTLVTNSGRSNIMDMINSVLGSLVAVTAGCFLYNGWESLVIGSVGALLTCLTSPLLDRVMKVDDPVGATPVHAVCGLWGVLAVGLFAAESPILPFRSRGLFKGGGPRLLGVQAIASLSLALYSFVVTVMLLWIIDKITPLRMSPRDELLGADYSEHMIRHKGVGVSRVESALTHFLPATNTSNHKLMTIGTNKGHEIYLAEFVKKERKKMVSTKIGTDDNESSKRIEAMMNELRFSTDPPPNIAWME